jgi:hypothetical protein
VSRTAPGRFVLVASLAALLAGCPAEPPAKAPTAALRLAFADGELHTVKVGDRRALVVTRGAPGEPAFSALLELNPAPPIAWHAAPTEAVGFEAGRAVFLRPGSVTVWATLEGERTNDLVVQVQDAR